MSRIVQDHWKEWIFARRHGSDPAELRTLLARLDPVRDRILRSDDFSDGKTLLDVGCGDGFVAFEALRRTERSIVWFSDVSASLLQHCENVAQKCGLVDRCRFIRAAADNLKGVPSNYFDLVTTRSVLIYVGDKRRALKEFHRVLKPGGAISLFEPIN